MDRKNPEFLRILHESIMQSPSKLQFFLAMQPPKPPLSTKSLKIASNILENSQESLDFLQSLFKYRIIFAENVFRAKTHGFSARSFHEKCDNLSNTLILFKTQHTGLKFGAFSAVSWESPTKSYYKRDKLSFLFSISKRTKHEVYKNEDFCVLLHKELGPCFGGGSDLRINDENQGNCSNLGFTYKFNEESEYDTLSTKTFLAGDLYFSLEDYEVFVLEFHF